MRSPSSPYPALSTFQVFVCILQAIWSSHYSSIFEGTSSSPHRILATIHSNLYKLHSQETITSFLYS
ncbi:hypothetical protein [Parasitella parasitica]|uniref:Uncharacterized protein n=1 Tax=Parasitella parasitica TaxID=35722 RepID=A0A0B7MNX0_9FUNG|nr:hypothetical protein [Parasitella parasitica]